MVHKKFLYCQRTSELIYKWDHVIMVQVTQYVWALHHTWAIKVTFTVFKLLPFDRYSPQNADKQKLDQVEGVKFESWRRGEGGFAIFHNLMSFMLNSIRRPDQNGSLSFFLIFFGSNGSIPSDGGWAIKIHHNKIGFTGISPNEIALWELSRKSVELFSDERVIFHCAPLR